MKKDVATKSEADSKRQIEPLAPGEQDREQKVVRQFQEDAGAQLPIIPSPTKDVRLLTTPLDNQPPVVQEGKRKLALATKARTYPRRWLDACEVAARQ